jgi:hypothetical protein
MMQQWGDYLDALKTGAKVFPFKKAIYVGDCRNDIDSDRGDVSENRNRTQQNNEHRLLPYDLYVPEINADEEIEA